MKKYITYTIIAFLCIGMLNAQDFNRDEMPKPGPTPKIKVAKPEIFKLRNGLTVMVVENHKLPKVDVSLSADRPPFYEGNIVGVGQIMSDQLGNGTASISKDDFNKRVDFLGAKLRFRTSGAYANMLSKYFEEVMLLMTDAIVNPLFDAEEVEKSKERTIADLKSSEKSAKTISENVFSALVYGKNTARGEFANEQNIKNITVKDVTDYYKKAFSPENFYLVIVGDVTMKQVRKVLNEGLSKWENTPNNTFAPLKPVKNVTQTEINIVNVPSAVQSIIKVGNLTNLQRKDKDYFATVIANYILGGGSLESRLNMNLREKNAFTYGAYSSLNTSKYSPRFMVSTNVRNAVVPGAIKEIMNELNAIPEITQEELQNAKARLKGSFIMSLEDPGTIADFSVSKLINDLPEDFYTNYLQSIDKVTVEDVRAAVQKSMLPKHARIFVAGKVTDFIAELEKMGYPISYYDREGMPTAKPKEKKLADNITVASIAAKYIAAIGGKDAVDKINSLKILATAKIQGMEMNLTNIVANGGKSLTDISMMGNSVNKVVFDGKEGYIQAQGQKTPIPEDIKAEKVQIKSVFPELNYATNSTLKLKGIENIKEQDAYAIENGKITYYYSVANGLKIAEIVTEKTPTGQEMVVPTYYSDYKEVNGILLPFVMTQEMMGQEIVFNVNSYEFNTAKDEDFQ